MDASQDSSASVATAPVREFDAVIVGAGFAGIYMLHRLRSLGLSAVVLEAGAGAGGTWYWNRYPGARCDSESYYYSYSFSPELQQEWEWSERYPTQPEILQYLDHVVDRFDLREHIHFRTRVTKAVFDSENCSWNLLTDTAERYSARFFVAAVGCLSAANIPQIPGIEEFSGETYHTSRWPHEGVEFAGKRVGVIGTGSTGIQAIPVIAEQADHVTVFQRTANYSVPARNRPLRPGELAEYKENLDEIRRLQRSTTNCHPYVVNDRSALSVTEEDRSAIYEAAWEQGGLGIRATFKDILTNMSANETLSEFIRSKIKTTVSDSRTAEKLSPRDHPFATKRPPIDTDYFETYNRPNVSLVDVKQSPIEAFTREGLRTTSEEYELDIIVFATGFDAMTGPLLGIDIETTDGASLREKWANGPHTYLGLQVAGFPNLFTITGPGSPSVLTNMPTAIEQHVEWISDCIEYMYKNGLTRVEAAKDAEEAWGDQVKEAADRTLLPLAESSWYLGANVPGKPRVFMPYAGGFAAYAHVCEEIAQRDYEGFIFEQS